MSTETHTPTKRFSLLPSTRAGRWSLNLLGLGIVLFSLWWFAIRIIWIALDEPGGDAVRLSVTVAAAGALGLAGVAGIVAAVRGERALLVLLPIIPQLTGGAFVLAEMFRPPGDHYSDVQIEVVFENGRVGLQRSGQDVSAIDGFVHLKLVARNLEAEPQRMGVMDLTRANASGNAAAPFTPAIVPIVDGRVRAYTYVDEPEIVFFTARGGFYRLAIARGADPPPRPGDLSLAVEAGGTRELDEFDLTPGTTLVIFSDLAGRYETGQRVVLEIR